MLEFHTNKVHQFSIQHENAKTAIIPFVSSHLSISSKTRVLEVGCAEAGILKAFCEAGCQCVGIEISNSRVENAKKFLDQYIHKKQLQLLVSDIYDIDPEKDFDDKFDLIVLKDVLEHIPEQERLMGWLKRFLRPGGMIYLSFPSWMMPFGGHQQIAFNKVLARTPWVHLLPVSVYRWVLKTFNRHEAQNGNLMEVWETRITIRRFEKIIKMHDQQVVKRQFYLVPPIYRQKFGLKTRKLNAFVGGIPFIREFFITSASYLIAPNKE